MGFFFNDTATTEIYTLSLHDALPIYDCRGGTPEAGGRRGRRWEGQHGNSDEGLALDRGRRCGDGGVCARGRGGPRSEEDTSELQSRPYLVWRLFLEKKKPNMQASCYI